MYCVFNKHPNDLFQYKNSYIEVFREVESDFRFVQFLIHPVVKCFFQAQICMDTNTFNVRE